MDKKNGVDGGGHAYDGELASVIDRLTQLVEEETADMRKRDLSKVAFYCDRKNRLLLEANRALSSEKTHGGLQVLAGKAKQLQVKLKENELLLKEQLAAVREFSEFLESEIRRNETDGTYTRSIGQGRAWA